MRRHAVICLLLAGITLALYWPAFHYGLVYYDDPLFMTESPEIQSGLSAHSFLWSFSTVIAANWHPLTTLSFVIDHQLFGTNPGAEHLVNALFHAANAALLFLLLAGMTGSRWRSAFAAAVFAWHPLRVESVAWITERKDVLSGFFFLLTLLCYARAAGATPLAENAPRQAPRPMAPVCYWLALLFLALGLMSKAMLVTVPFVLLLLDIWPLGRVLPCDPQPLRQARPRLPAGDPGRNVKKLIGEKWPFFLTAVAFSALTYHIQKNYAAVVSLDRLGWNYRIANAITSYLRYLGKLFWPADLAVIYPYQRIDDWLATGLIAVVLVVISGVCLMQIRRRPYLAVGWFWYVGTALPIIGLVQVGGAAMADRYSYLTLIGPVVALIWLLPETWASPGVSRRFMGLGAAFALGALLFLTRLQIHYWRDTISLFAHAVAVTGDNPAAESALGIGLERAGRIAEALEHQRKAVALNPDDPQNYLAVGNLLMRQNQWAEAAEEMKNVLAAEPNNLTAEESLGAILPHLGRSAEAARHLEAALEIAPDDTGALNNLAWLLATSADAGVRDGKRAVSLAERGCELTHFKKTFLLGTLAASYAEAGRFDDAVATAQRACDSAGSHGETELLAANQKLLALYQKHQPYHEAAN